MDVAVISWCKCFGSKRSEALHWEHLFPPEALDVRPRLQAVLEAYKIEDLSTDIRNYRNTYVVHNDLDEAKRAKFHPYLVPLELTGRALFQEVFRALEMHGSEDGLPDPLSVQGEALIEIENRWIAISNAARSATENWTD